MQEVTSSILVSSTEVPVFLAAAMNAGRPNVARDYFGIRRISPPKSLQ